MSLNTHMAEACTSYLTCGLWLHLSDINWGTVGAGVLLFARLVKDVPEAWEALNRVIAKRKRKKSRDQSKR